MGGGTRPGTPVIDDVRAARIISVIDWAPTDMFSSGTRVEVAPPLKYENCSNSALQLRTTSTRTSHTEETGSWKSRKRDPREILPSVFNSQMLNNEGQKELQ